MFFFFLPLSSVTKDMSRVFWERLQLESLEMWVTDQSLLFAGHCDFELSLLQISVSSSVEWDDWSGLIYKILSRSNCLSWGAGGQMSFSSELLLPSGAPPPNPHPHPSCSGSSQGWARHTFLCFKFFVLHDGFALMDRLISMSCFLTAPVYFFLSVQPFVFNSGSFTKKGLLPFENHNMSLSFMESGVEVVQPL